MQGFRRFLPNPPFRYFYRIGKPSQVNAINLRYSYRPFLAGNVRPDRFRYVYRERFSKRGLRHCGAIGFPERMAAQIIHA